MCSEKRTLEKILETVLEFGVAYIINELSVVEQVLLMFLGRCGRDGDSCMQPAPSSGTYAPFISFTYRQIFNFRVLIVYYLGMTLKAGRFMS
jgi:hypothetical protein